MHRLLAAAALAVLFMLPATARAWTLSASLGKGAKVSPSPVEAEPINVMIAPGFDIAVVRLELGFLNSLPDTKASKYDIELRPMLVIKPPIIPIYGRAIFAVANLLGKNQKTEIAYGAALGLEISLGPLGVFVEAGALPRSRKYAVKDATGTTTSTEAKFSWVVEGRVGAILFF